MKKGGIKKTKTVADVINCFGVGEVRRGKIEVKRTVKKPAIVAKAAGRQKIH